MTAKGHRVLACVVEEFEPLDTVDLGVPESENLHNAGGFFGARYGDPALDYGGEPVRVRAADGICHWRDFTREAGIELVCPEEAIGWPKRIEALVSTYRVGDPAEPVPTKVAVRLGDGDHALGEAAIPGDGRWHLLSFDLPDPLWNEPRLLLWFDDEANHEGPDSHWGRHLATVRLLGRITPDTSWSAVAKAGEKS